jgi:hypothetical protein
MIDTDKYEGHTPPHWVWIDWIGLPATLKDVDKNLMQDAPLLLQEVKRLREAIADIANNMEAADPSYLQGFIKDLLEVIE